MDEVGNACRMKLREPMMAQFDAMTHDDTFSDFSGSQISASAVLQRPPWCVEPSEFGSSSVLQIDPVTFKVLANTSGGNFNRRCHPHFSVSQVVADEID